MAKVKGCGSRVQAEGGIGSPARVRFRVFGAATRHTGPLAVWLARQECADYDGPGRKWDGALLAYDAACDATCSQPNLSERDVLELLSGQGGTAPCLTYSARCASLCVVRAFGATSSRLRLGLLSVVCLGSQKPPRSRNRPETQPFHEKCLNV